MQAILFREAPACLPEFACEAVSALGYFRPDAAAALTAIFVRIWPNGLSSTAIIYSDLEDMTGEEKAAACIGRGRMPRDFWVILNERGRANPFHAAKAATLRILFNIRRAEHDSEEPQSSASASRLELHGITNFTCAAARVLNGMTVPPEGCFALPLVGCASEWCACRWDILD